jgi:hypothetical protein
MNIPLLGKNKARVITEYLTNEDTVTMPNGTPVALVMNGTDDGFGIVLPSTAGAQKSQSLFVGVVDAPSSASATSGGIASNFGGDVIIGGLARNALIVMQTRASSSNNWATYSAISSGDALSVNTVVNAFSLFTQGSALTGLQYPNIVACQTVASGASSASAASDTRTAITAAINIWLRLM